MKNWEVRFLGTPEAWNGQARAHLRSRKTWCVLASLLEASRTSVGGWLSKHTLVSRFWPDSDNGPVSLRMALHSLRIAFGEESFDCERERIRINAGNFRTDLDQIVSMWHSAQQDSDEVERLNLLGKLEALLGGEFLEGCHADPTLFGINSEANWLDTQRTQWNMMGAEILCLLAETLEAGGNVRTAFDIACRAITMHPTSLKLSETVWRLGRKTDRTPIALALHRSLDFPETLVRVMSRESLAVPLIPSEINIFRSQLQFRLDELPDSLRKLCRSLSMFATRFRIEHAQAICGAGPTALRKLYKEQIIDQQGDHYLMPAPIRRILWGQIDPSTKRKLLARYTQLCTTWINAFVENHKNARNTLFRSLDDAEPHLEQVITIHLNSEPSEAGVNFIIFVGSLRLTRFYTPSMEYCERALRMLQLSPSVRFSAGHFSGYTAIDLREFHHARELLIATTAINFPELPPQVRGRLLFNLALACHHAEHYEEALSHVQIALELYIAERDFSGQVEAARFQCEILRSQGDFEGSLKALELCEVALSQCRDLPGYGLRRAEYLYQLGASKSGVGNSKGAMEDWMEALALRQNAGDDSGSADCLRRIGAQLAQEGVEIEARIYLDHALLLYDRARNPGGSAAAQEILGTLLARQGEADLARRHFESALNYWNLLGHNTWIGSVQRQLDALV